MPRDQHRDPKLVQVLSLYLLLLAIFVLLFSMSRTEESKVRSVTGSLKSTFSSTGVPTAEPDVLTSLLGDPINHAEIEQKFSRLIKTAIPLTRIKVIRPGRLLEARLGADQLFDGASSQIKPGRRRLISRIASLLGDAPPGIRRELEVIVGGTDSRLSGRDGGASLPVARASEVAAAIVAAGAPRGTTAGGFEVGDGNTVRLLFRQRAAEEPRGAIGRSRAGEMP